MNAGMNISVNTGMRLLCPDSGPELKKRVVLLNDRILRSDVTDSDTIIDVQSENKAVGWMLMQSARCSDERC